MPDAKVSLLPVATTLVGNEQIPIVQGGTLKQVLASNFVADLKLSTGTGGTGGAPLDASYIVTGANTTLTNEKVATATPSIKLDLATVGQAKFKRAALTGDVAADEDSNVTTIQPNTVGNTELEDVPAYTFKGNAAAVTGDASDIPVGVSQLVGRGTGTLGAVALGSNLTLTGTGTRTLDVSLSEAKILAAGNFLRYVSNGDGSFSLVLADDSVVESLASVYSLAGITIAGVTELPAASTFPVGTVVRLHKDNFIGQGVNSLGVMVASDGNKWKPHNRQMLFSSQFASTTLTAAGKFAIGVDPKIPAGLLYSGAKLRIRAKYRKVSTTAPNIAFYIGTSTTHTANSSFYNVNLSAVENLDVNTESELIFTSTSEIFSTRHATSGGGGTANNFATLATAINTTLPMYVSFAVASMATDTVQLYRYEIIWEE